MDCNFANKHKRQTQQREARHKARKVRQARGKAQGKGARQSGLEG